MSSALAELRARLDTAPMSRTQVFAVAITVILSALDGFDVLSVTFAAPAISRDWGIGKVELGLILSSGLAGMALGSFFIAPLADRFGRKPLTLLSLALMAIGMALSSLAPNVSVLAATRVLTGLGIGACIAVINPLAAEFANARRRPLAVSLMALGYPAGGIVGGLLAAWLLEISGWPAIFLTGAVGSAALIPLVALALPESPAFLISGSRADLARLNTVLIRCAQAPLNALPPAPAVRTSSYRAIFAGEQRAITVAMSAVNMCSAIATYYFLSWLPQLIADAGFSASSGSRVSALASIAGIIGGILLGVLAQRFGPIRLTAGMMIGLACALTALGFVPARLELLVPVATAGGFFLFSAAAGFYATLASAFGDATRATGSGFVIGVGRVSSALGPIVAGFLFAAGLGREEVSASFGALTLVAASVLLIADRRGMVSRSVT